MSASARVLDVVRRARRPLRLLGASGQLGYGIPTPAFNAGLAREPDLIGADMGSIDIGPTYLGRGEMATAPAATRRDLRKLLLGARRLDVPLVIGSAGSAGAKPHLDATLAMVRDIARADGLSFRLGVLRADVDRRTLRRALAAGEITGLDGMPPLTGEDIDAAAHIVGQMGSSPFRRALLADIDVLIAGRSCDTAIFAALPTLLGFPPGLAMHAAKIIECASLCCVPGGRDAILATLDDEGFALESMAPQRRATPVSVAAHSLYEQADPYAVHEPEGTLDLLAAGYVAVDDRRTRVTGAVWKETIS
ncbi:MAG: acyclic terpene utilization AtuA family protein, partial [Acetobacteraceae bacterium]